MNSYDRGTGVVEIIFEFIPKQQSCTLREGEVIKKAGGGGSVFESEVFQGGEENPFRRRCGRWLEWVFEGDSDVFEQRALFEEGDQISDGHDGFRLESEPCEGGKVEVVEVRAKITQQETRKLRE